VLDYQKFHVLNSWTHITLHIFKSHGALMKDYVFVPDSVLNDSNLFLSYIDKSYNHVMSLKPK